MVFHCIRMRRFLNAWRGRRSRNRRDLFKPKLKMSWLTGFYFKMLREAFEIRTHVVVALTWFGTFNFSGATDRPFNLGWCVLKTSIRLLFIFAQTSLRPLVIGMIHSGQISVTKRRMILRGLSIRHPSYRNQSLLDWYLWSLCASFLCDHLKHWLWWLLHLWSDNVSTLISWKLLHWRGQRPWRD